MFKKEEVIKAVEIQNLGYKFLKYISEKIDDGEFTFSKSHENESSANVILDWLNTYYDYLPKSILPQKSELKEFSNYFASMLTTSFQINEEPERAYSSWSCYCDICMQFSNLTHLKSISPKQEDRDMAKQKRNEFLQEFSQYLNIELSDYDSIKLAENNSLHQDIAILTYTKSLFGRIKHSKGGVYMLALWREFAWSKGGGPIPDFNFSATKIFDATRRLEREIERIRKK